jgi:hypothetical protein
MTFLSMISGLNGLEVIVVSTAPPASAVAETGSGGTISTLGWEGKNRRSRFAFTAVLTGAVRPAELAAMQHFPSDSTN